MFSKFAIIIMHHHIFVEERIELKRKSLESRLLGRRSYVRTASVANFPKILQSTGGTFY
jgi:hypothetical protein